MGRITGEFCRLRNEFLAYIDFHLLIQAIIHNQTMSHPNPVRFHGMPCNIGIIAHVRIVKVCNGLLVGASWYRELLIHRGKGRHG